MKTKLWVLLCICLWCSGMWGTPHFSTVSFPETVGRYQKYEIDFELNSYPNPYNYDQIDTWAEFVSPTGKVFKVYGFYYEGYHKLDDGAPTSYEILAPSGANNWKVRFSPNETGRWTFRLNAVDILAHVTAPDTGRFSFVVTASNEKGFISLANNRYLKYDSGDPFIPIGDSYPWWLVTPWRAGANGREKGTNIAKHYLEGMHANGFTYNRFEANFFEGLSLIGRDYVLQKSFYRYYNQHDAWQLDEIMEYSKEMGINVNLALLAHVIFSDEGSFHYLDPETQTFVYIPDTNSQGIPVLGYGFGNWALFNPYNKYQDPRFRPEAPDTVGPCESKYDFFSHPEAIREQKKLFRYIVARWGYCTNLMAFELVDEIGSVKAINGNDLNPHYVPTPPNGYQTLGEWHSTMYDFIKSVDPNKHLISAAMGDEGPAPFIVPHMDFVNIHPYTDYRTANTGGLQEPFEYILATNIQGLAKRYDKPVAVMETNWCAAQVCEDPRLYDLHNLIWSALFNGSMGLTAIWAHEHEVLGSGALYQFAGVGAYSRLLPLFNESYVPQRFVKDGLKWEFLANYLEDKMYGRVQDDNFTYFSLWNGMYKDYLASLSFADRPPLSSGVFTGTFPVARKGTYQVTWYNTETGAFHSSTQVVSDEDSITLKMPDDLRYSTWADAGFMVEFIDGESSLMVYPNPSKDAFTVHLKHDKAVFCRYAIYSSLGAVVVKDGIDLGPEDPSFSLDLQGYSVGTYFLVVNFAGNSITKKLVKL